MTEKTINLKAVDSWFFRETKPMNAGGDAQSIFPPGIRTVAGAIRTWIGEKENVDWKAYKENDKHPLRKTIGSNKDGDLGGLSFKGVWINKDGARLYPAPLHLLKKEQQLYQLILNEEGTHCDLGKNIRLPKLPSDDAKGSKPLENTWIDASTYQILLQGEAVSYDKENCGNDNKHFFNLDSIFTSESRTGLARDNTKRTAIKGNLYQAQHIRPQADISLEVDIKGLPESCQQGSALVRLGGESRGASLHVNEQSASLAVIDTKNINVAETQGIIIYLLSALEMTYEDYKIKPLPSFKLKEKEEADTSYWEGKIEGIPLKLHGAVVGKSIRDGGWDMAERKPRDDRSLIPAGSLYYCEVVDGDIAKAINAIHGKQLGKLQQYGYGQLAVGIWKKG